MKHAEIGRKNRKNSLKFERLLLFLCALGTVFLLAWVLKFSNYGVDFTDEGFYLVWIANPYLYDWSATQFGFIYHVLFFIFSGDIASLRKFNIILTFGLSWALAYLALRSLVVGFHEKKAELHILASGFGTASLIVFDNWLVTPSYNGLAFQALLVSSIGLMLSEKNRSLTSVVGWVLLGVGGWLAFMAKPTTAIALGGAVLIFLVVCRRVSVVNLFVAVLSAVLLLFVSALLIDGSVTGFVDRIRIGVQFANFLKAGHTLENIFRVDSFVLGFHEIIAIAFLFVSSFVLATLAFAEKKLSQLLLVLLSVVFLGGTISLALGVVFNIPGFGGYQRMVTWGVVFSIIALSFKSAPKKMLASISLQQWSIALLFLFMPYIYAFGTRGNYWKAGAGVAIFWLLSSLFLLRPLVVAKKGLFFLLPVVIVVQSLTATLLQKGMEFPYRQIQPLRLNDSPVEVGMPGSTLVLSAGYAKYLEDVKRVAQRAGFTSATPMIDLTGQSPGVLYALRAENIGQAWTIGGYPGSAELAVAALGRADCEKIAAAWVLHENAGPRSIPSEILLSLGADFPKHYQEMGSWQTAEGAGGRRKVRVQVLYAPMAEKTTLESCHAIRDKNLVLESVVPRHQFISHE